MILLHHYRNERMCNEEERASCKRHEKRVFPLIDNARV